MVSWLHEKKKETVSIQTASFKTTKTIKPIILKFYSPPKPSANPA